MRPCPTSLDAIRLAPTGLGLLLILTACSKAPDDPDPPIFADHARASGLTFQHQPGNRGEYYFPEIAGGGVALLDFDRDGDLDVFFVQSGFLGDPIVEQTGNALFENRLNDGEFDFVDITAASGLSYTGYGMGAAVGDYDDDGDSDIYVTAFGPNYLFRNEGGGRFTDITAETGTTDERWSTSAVFFDYNNDRQLDLYLINYASFSLSHNKRCRLSSGALEYCGPSAYEPVTDRLYRNNGDGSFSDQTSESGLDRAYGTGLGVTVSDFNSDGMLDIYVANDGRPNQLWLNDEGRFRDHGLSNGAAYNAHGMTEASMGVSAGDFDGDGDDDLFMTHLRNETNTLYQNDGQANFTDSTNMVGVGPPSRPRTGFGTAWIDFDNDGLLDLFVANGAVTAVPQQDGAFPYREHNQLFHNLGGVFEDVSDQAGPAVTDEWVSRGAAFGDIDNDGDTDIVVVNANAPAQLLLNQVGNRANWIGVDLKAGGAVANHARIGVAVAEQIRWRTSRRDGSYLSASDPRVLVGLGGYAGAVDLLVAWRDGTIETWPQISQRQYHALRPGTGTSLDEFCAQRRHAFCTEHASLNPE